MTLSGANTYTGTTFLNGGTIKISAANNLGAGTQLMMNGGMLDVTTAGFTLAQNMTLNGSGTIETDSGTLTESGNIAETTNTLTVSGSGNTTLNGIFSSDGGGLTKIGTGTPNSRRRKYLCGRDDSCAGHFECWLDQ